MNSSWLLAFVVTPAAAVALGWMAVLLHERSLKRSRQGPGE
ncbi:MAG TPA: hypothetical protein VHL98_05645 [Microvirga sp.]|jgi:hypothetical protein|nr:hypothetical protein [Microvirga sp.]